jgi:hypothetical protein
LIFGAKVGVYRCSTENLEPFSFVEIDGDTVTVQNTRGRNIFRSDVVKYWEAAAPQQATDPAVDDNNRTN